MERRSRKRSAAPAPRLRGEERDAAIRATLEPLAPGERPAAVTVGAIVAALLAVTNIALYVARVSVRGTRPSLAGVLVFAAVLGAAAYGMSRASYWAVLGFQALLGVSIAYAALSLIVASNLEAVALCLGIMGLGGWLFWKLVRSMARIQMPPRSGR